MNTFDLSEQAIFSGTSMLQAWSKKDISISKNLHHSLPFETLSSRAECFIGHINSSNQRQSILGCQQVYTVANFLKKGENLEQYIATYFAGNGIEGFAMHPIFTKNKHGHIEEKPNQNNALLLKGFLEKKHQSITFDLKIPQFYQPMTGPSIVKNRMAKKHPMSALVVVDQQLCQPMDALDKIPNTIYFCYAFLNKKTGPTFWGFGPGKFEKAIKHYAFTKNTDNSITITLTAIIAPRSEKVLNVLGFDPIYSGLKFANALTLGQFNLYEKGKEKAELFMMEHHVKVHELMIAYFLKR